MTNDTRLTSAGGNPVRELCRPDNASHEASIRIALEAAGIEAVYHRAAGFGDAAQVLVRTDDYERAKQAIGGLQSTSNAREVDIPLFRRVRWIAGAVVALTVLRGMWMIFSR